VCSYPFVDDQPIPFGWEEVLVELSADIIVDPSPARKVFHFKGRRGLLRPKKKTEEEDSDRT
jgi:hypothetical protein